jgi:hypothetical protein
MLILTKDNIMRAHEIDTTNDGVKFFPVDEVINKPKGDSVEPFTDDDDEPEWTGMG